MGRMAWGATTPRGCLGSVAIGKRLWRSRAVEKSQSRLSHRAWKSRAKRGIPTSPQPRRRRVINSQPDNSLTTKTGPFNLLRTVTGLLRFYNHKSRGENLLRVAEAREPVHAGFLAKPSDLALGETPRGLLNLLHGVFFAQLAGKMFAKLRVADELKWFRVRRNTTRDQPAHFFQPSGCEHRVSACVNARIERCTWRQQSDFHHIVSLQGIASAAMDFAHRFSGEQAQFDRTNYFLRVRRRDARSRFGIQARQHAMQTLGTALFGPLPQTRADFFGALRSIGKAFEQRAQIQPGASGQDRQNLARAQVVQSFQGATPVISGRENFGRLAEIHQVMRNAALFSRGNFR